MKPPPPSAFRGSPLKFHSCVFCGALIVSQSNANEDGGRIVHEGKPCEKFRLVMASFDMQVLQPPPGESFVAMAGDPEGLRRTLPLRLVRSKP